LILPHSLQADKERRIRTVISHRRGFVIAIATIAHRICSLNIDDSLRGFEDNWHYNCRGHGLGILIRRLEQHSLRHSEGSRV
jgi:hypothetical protein